MTETQVTNQAIQLLNDPAQDLFTREAAIHELASRPTPANLERLIDALEDPTASIRWVAADDLAHLGALALPPLLHRLASEHDSLWVREGAYHICHYSSSPIVREQTKALQRALHGLAAEVATTGEASKLLCTLLYKGLAQQ
ncbi:MAG: HEAT repeat domain-containing protein [Caldilineaceae bacterium]